MVSIPENVDDWTLGTITDILNEGYDENVTLEFKSKINEQTEKIPKTACAFANTEGGFLIFGVDNDRTKQLSITERMIGLDDSDDLHKKIIDKIRNITPQIPIENLIFRKSGIKLDSNKVIVILKIKKSLNRPHQYDYVFYKRLPGSNERMDPEEIKKMILDTQKKITYVELLFQELAITKKFLDEVKTDLENKNTNALAGSQYVHTTSSTHFLYDQAYLYQPELGESLSLLIHEINRLSNPPFKIQRLEEKTIPEFLKKLAKDHGYDDPKEFFMRALLERAKKALEMIKYIEKYFDRKILEPPDLIIPEKKK